MGGVRTRLLCGLLLLTVLLFVCSLSTAQARPRDSPVSSSDGSTSHGHSRHLKTHAVRAKDDEKEENDDDAEAEEELNAKSAPLLGAILVSRHGTRAPNLVTTTLCPSNAENIARYAELDISLEGVTGKGMRQMYSLGVATRKRYIEEEQLLSPFFNNKELYIRAVGEDRTLQSAIAWGHGLFPAGTGPKGYLRDVPAPLPVYTIPDDLDTLLENRKSGCRIQLKKDVETYDTDYAPALFRKHAALIDDIEKMCGVNLTTAIKGSGDNFGDAIKDITDGWTFDYLEGFPLVEGLTVHKLLRVRELAVHLLFHRIVGTDEQITYMNGDLPEALVSSFQDMLNYSDPDVAQASNEKGISPPLQFLAYHGHREMIYAVAAFFDIRFNISFPALPVGAVPPAASLFFDLYGGKQPYVRLSLWVPCDPIGSVHGKKQVQPEKFTSKDLEDVDCPLHPLRMYACSRLNCPFSEFASIVERRITRTGEWRSLCVATDEELEREEEHPGSSLTRSTNATKPANAPLTDPGNPRAHGHHSHTPLSKKSSKDDADSDEEEEEEREPHHHAKPAKKKHKAVHSTTGGKSSSSSVQHKLGSALSGYGWVWIVVLLIGSVIAGGLLYYCFCYSPQRVAYQPI